MLSITRDQGYEPDMLAVLSPRYRLEWIVIRRLPSDVPPVSSRPLGQPVGSPRAYQCAPRLDAHALALPARPRGRRRGAVPRAFGRCGTVTHAYPSNHSRQRGPLEPDQLRDCHQTHFLDHSPSHLTASPSHSPTSALSVFTMVSATRKTPHRAL